MGFHTPPFGVEEVGVGDLMGSARVHHEHQHGGGLDHEGHAGGVPLDAEKVAGVLCHWDDLLRCFCNHYTTVLSGCQGVFENFF